MPPRVSRFGERYREVIERAAGVQEGRAQYRGVPIRERVARCLWFGQHLRTGSLRTLDGEALRVVSPGWWNVEEGPDFLLAELAFGNGPIQRGDAEIHLHASGWYDHGHHQNPAYNQVILHVVLWNDREDDFVVNQAGRPVRQLVIEDNLEEDLGELMDRLAHEDFPQPASPTAGLCQQFLKEEKVSETWVADFLDDAGDERILRKGRALARRAVETGDDQAFYESFMAALGYKKNKEAFENLARLVPLYALAEAASRCPAAIQALLFDAAGLLPREQLLPGMPDRETCRLQQAYAAFLRESSTPAPEHKMGDSDWKFSGTRPVNFPTRRIAAAAHFLAANVQRGLVNTIQQAVLSELDSTGTVTSKSVQRVRRALQETLFASEDPYWSFRCTFGGKPVAKPMRLLGAERVNVLLVNVIIPALLARARQRRDAALESLLHEVYDQLPPLVETQVTRFMVARVFGDETRAEKLVTTARRQQGLYQLYSDFERDDRNCEDCPFALAMLLG